MRKFLQRLTLVATAALVSVALPVSTFALSEEDLYFYGQNNILFFDPGGGCSAGGGNNMNYAGATVWSESELAAIEANRSFYEQAANAYGFSWTLLATVHSMETSLRRYSPSSSWDSTKSEGPYQLHSWAKNGTVNYPVQSSLTDAEFLQMTMDAARFIKENYLQYDLNTRQGVMKVLVSYNGLAPQYVQKAINMGFASAEANNGEGSVYVMNRYDARRDPTSNQMSPYWPGRFEGDGVYVEGSTTEVFGAYVKYEALGGPGATCGNALISGGMTLEQGREFMSYYVDKVKEYQYTRGDVELDGAYLKDQGCKGGPLANCVTFVKWFLVKYTSLEVNYVGLGNGNMVVNTLSNMGLSTGTKPQPYAVFSVSTGEYGHTGVVLGVDETNNKIIIGEAGCSGGADFTAAREYALSDFTDHGYTYAYLDTVLTGV